MLTNQRTWVPHPHRLHRLGWAGVATLVLITLSASAQDAPLPDIVPQHPALFLVGDSIMRTGTGGWAYDTTPMFDAAKIHVYNDGLGGRSSRGYIEEGAWKKVLDHVQAG